MCIQIKHFRFLSRAVVPLAITVGLLMSTFCISVYSKGIDFAASYNFAPADLLSLSTWGAASHCAFSSGLLLGGVLIVLGSFSPVTSDAEEEIDRLRYHATFIAAARYVMLSPILSF